jgi:lysophospholipid acyltransferase
MCTYYRKRNGPWSDLRALLSFYFPAFLVGPSLTYSEYMSLVTETLYEGAVTSGSKMKRVPLGRKRAAYQKLAFGLVSFGVYAVYDSKFSYSVVLTNWWMTKSFWYR